MTDDQLEKAKHIIDIACQESGICRDVLMSRDRHSNVAMARFVVYYVLHDVIGIGYPTIAKLMSRTHRTVIWGTTTARSWNPSNKFRDKAAKENQELLERVINKLEQYDNFRTTNTCTV